MDPQAVDTSLATQDSSNSRKRRPSTLFSDAYVAKEMDVPAVEATRSYRAWLSLPEGSEFVYNQKYIKGKKESQANPSDRLGYKMEPTSL